MATAVLGTAAIRVRPDTRGFKDALRDDIQRIEKTVSIRPAIEIAKREVQQVKAKLQAVDTTVDIKPQIRQADIAKAKAALAPIKKTNVQAILDESTIRTARAELSAKLDNITAHPRVAITAAKAQLRRLADPIDVAVTPRVNKAKLALSKLREPITTTLTPVVTRIQGTQQILSRATAATKTFVQDLGDKAAAQARSSAAVVTKHYNTALQRLSKSSRSANNALVIGGALSRTAVRKISASVDAVSTTLTPLGNKARSAFSNIAAGAGRASNAVRSLSTALKSTSAIQSLGQQASRVFGSMTATLSPATLLSGFTRLKSVATGALRGIAVSAAGVGRALLSATGSALKLIPAMAALGSVSLAGIAGATQAATSTVVALGAALKATLPFIGALPAMAGAGAAGLVAVRAAVATAKEELEEYGETFKQMYADIGDAAWKTGGGQVTRATERLIPVLSSGMTKVGAALGTAMGKVADAISSARGLSAIKTVLESTARAFDPLGDALADIVDGLLHLAKAGAPLIERLSNAVARLGKRFAAWANDVADSGKLLTWVDDAIATFKQLGTIIVQLGGILKGLGTAMGVTGGSIQLDLMVSSLTAVNNAINGPLAQGALREIFDGARDAVKALGPGVTDLLHALAGFAPTLSNLLRIGSAAFGALLSGVGAILNEPMFRAGVTQLFTGVQALAEGLRELGPVIGRVLGGAASVIGSVASGIASILPYLEPVIEVLAQVLTFISGQLDKVPGLVDTAAGSFGRLFEPLQTAWSMVEPVLQRMGDVLLNAFSGFDGEGALSGLSGIFEPLLNGVLEVIGALTTLFEQIWPGIEPIIQRIATQTLPLLAEAWGSIFGTISSVLEHFGEKLGPLIEPLGNLLLDIYEMFIEYAPKIWDILGQVAEFIINILAAILPPVMSVVSVIKDAIAQTLDWLLPIIQSAIGWLNQLVEPIQRIFNSLAELLVPAIRWFADQLQKLEPVVRMIIDVVGTFLVNAFNVVADAIGFLVALFQGDFAAAWEYLKSFFLNLGTMIWDAITGVVSAVLEMIATIGSVLWDGAITVAGNFVRGLIDTIKNGLSGLKDRVMGWLGFDTGVTADVDADVDWGDPMPSYGSGPGSRGPSGYDSGPIGGGQTINIYNPVNEPSSETLRRNSAHLTGGY